MTASLVYKIKAIVKDSGYFISDYCISVKDVNDSTF